MRSCLQIKVRGFDVPIGGAPRQEIHRGPGVSTVGLIGADYPGVRAVLRVATGDRVTVGQTIFVDRYRPAIAFSAPVSGRIQKIQRGPRRSLEFVAIAREGREARNGVSSPHAFTRDGLRSLLCSHGMWPALRERPFGYIPDPGTVPDAIFVTALDTAPLAADPTVVIAEHTEAFRAGADALRCLTDGVVYICQAPGPALGDHAVVFSGPHPAGLPGTHIHHLHPVGDGRVVWHLGYQDTIAIGYLISRGEFWTDRVVALAGPSVREPRLVRTCLGADIEALTHGGLWEGPKRVLSGSILDGRRQAYLGRYHHQVTALPERKEPTVLSFGTRVASTAVGGWPGPIIPLRVHGRAPSLRAPPIPLLRALSVGDVESAERLGSSEMVEEDVALLSYFCPSKTNYGQLLRGVLEQSRSGGEAPVPTVETSPATTVAPHARSSSSSARVTLFCLLALLAPVGWASSQGGSRFVLVLGLAALVSAGWQLLFVWLRDRPFSVQAPAAQITTAATIALMLPPEVPLWHVALGTSFGVVMAEQIFGGRGYNFLNAAVVALAFLAFSFPDMNYGVGGDVVWLATLPGALLLVAAGILSWRILAAMAVATVAVSYGTVDLLPDILDINTLAFAAVFLGCDPITAPVTNVGRLIYGLLVGGLWGLGISQGEIPVVSALLLGGIFAPLIDHLVVLGHGAWRRRRYG